MCGFQPHGKKLMKKLESWKMDLIIKKIVIIKNNSILKNSLKINHNKNFNIKNKKSVNEVGKWNQ